LYNFGSDGGLGTVFVFDNLILDTISGVGIETSLFNNELALLVLPLDDDELALLDLPLDDDELALLDLPLDDDDIPTSI
jgi:hypothetical protein